MLVDDIISSLMRLRHCWPLFSHIQSVTSPLPNVIDIQLSEVDKQLPLLLGSPHAAIIPKEWESIDNFDKMPIGTGPFSLRKTCLKNSRLPHLIAILVIEHSLMK